MGKSPNSCFKIIACGADITDVDDELLPPESKQSSDKRRWSFRKRSARHQVPSNIVVSEPQFVGFDKENPEATADKFYPVKDSSVPEKTPVIDQANVTAPLPSDVVIPEKTPVIEQANVTTPLPTDVVNPEKIPVIEQANVTAPLPSNAVNPENTPFVEETNETAPLSLATVNSESPPVTGQANGTAPFSSAVVNSEVEAAPDTDNITPAVDAYLQEKVAVVIQAAARRFMAQRELQKLKNVVKLQAAVRGHLVRKQAIGTLRCVQAIAKMQILVRARRAHQCQFLEKDIGEDKNNEDFQIDLVRRNPDIKSNRTNTTVEKLLSNGFARQLLENTSKTKLINISCDPLRHDSAWQWLERWMAVTSSKVEQEQEFSCPHGFQGENENSKLAYDELDVNPVVGPPMLSDSQLSSGKSAAAEGGEDSKTDSFGEFESQALSIVSDQCFSSAEGNKEHSQGEEAIGIVEENFTQTVEGKEIFDAGSRSAHVNHPIYTDSVTDNFNHSTKRATFDPVETEGKKIDLGSRKNRNPAFAAVQAKFEELSSAPKAHKSVSVCRDAAVESKPNHSQVVSLTENKDLSSTENSTTQNPIIQVAGSECGTEISISSTLDSPDRSETDGGEIVLELGTSGEGNHNATSSASEAFNIENMTGEAKGVFTISDELKEQRPKEDNENMIISIAGVDSVKVNQQPIIWNQQENLKAEAYRSSPEGSPRSHITAPELHDTPSSQVSVQSNRSRSQNNVPARKPKSKSGSKNSPSNARNDSDGRSSTGHLLKDAKNANRQSSLGMAKLDHAGNEPRRSSSNSLPSYMQATESARAKAHGSVSLKSSPDVHDKDNQMKRHSLPIGDEKQGSSPRVQRSTSQTQQSAKRNNNHSPQGSAERRWQR